MERFDSPKKIIGDTLYELGKENQDICFVSCDTSLGTGADKFKKFFPERHFEFGIQEQNAVTQAAGMAISGMIPFIGAHVPFITLKTVEQIRDDICKTNLNVNIIGRDFGFQLSMTGPTHMILEDLGILRTIPNLTILAPADGPEYRNAMIESVKLDGPVFIRVSRKETRRINPPGYSFKIGQANLLKEGKDITVFAISTMVNIAAEAVDILKEEGIDAELINIHTLKPIDRDTILSSSSKTKKVVTIEEHSVIGGLGSAVAEILIQENPVKMKIIGTGDCFSIVGEDYAELLDHYGLSVGKIVLSIKDFLTGQGI